MRTRIDGDQLNELEADLRGAPARIQVDTREGVKRAAKRIAKEMRVDASGHRYLADLPRAVSYTAFFNEAEIGLGPRRGTQGSLAHIIAYGSVNNAPVYDYTAGLRRAEPKILEDFADDAESDVLGKGGKR